MRFEKIVISNYRQYESLTLEFPKTTESDLHVVIASNGIGKTNLLNAIDWCLYGEETHLGDKDESLSICNLNAIDYAKEKGLSYAIVSVKIYAKEKTTDIIFERTVTVNPKTLVPGISQFQITRTPIKGNTEILVDDAARDAVNAYLPRKIKQYFFFDGEQLYNYFGKGQDTTHVKDSIHEIAQINVVTNVRMHLQSLINDKQKEIAKLNPTTEKFQKELEELKQALDNRLTEIEILKSSNLEAEDSIDELSSKIAGQEHVADDDRRYNQCQKEIDELEDHKKELIDSLHELIRQYYVLLTMYEVNQRTSDYINDKEGRGLLPPDINKDLLLRSLDEHKCAICGQEINDDIKVHLKELFKKFEVSTSVSNKLMEIKNDTIQACKKARTYESQKQHIFGDIRKTDNKIEELEEEAQALYQKISTCSSREELQSWMEERERLKKLKTVNEQKVGSYEEECLNLKKKIVLKESQIDEATKGESRCKELKAQLGFANEALAIVQQTENEVVSEVRTQMERETYEIFSGLIWKQNTYGRIELSNEYRLRLFHVHGDSCLGSCSAAERELLALAFTLALHRVSHHDSLLFIDTPVGRVSDENRECFAKSLISVSQTKQLILAFTPSEYSIEISKYFDSCASSCNKLGTPNETATIRVGGK